MNVFIQQTIQINLLKVGGIANSSVLQIGSTGIIKEVSNLYNTGGFTAPAPEAIKPDEHYLSAELTPLTSLGTITNL